MIFFGDNSMPYAVWLAFGCIHCWHRLGFRRATTVVIASLIPAISTPRHEEESEHSCQPTVGPVSFPSFVQWLRVALWTLE